MSHAHFMHETIGQNSNAHHSAKTNCVISEATLGHSLERYTPTERVPAGPHTVMKGELFAEWRISHTCLYLNDQGPFKFKPQNEQTPVADRAHILHLRKPDYTHMEMFHDRLTTHRLLQQPESTLRKWQKYW